jgi:hypothetical protein
MRTRIRLIAALLASVLAAFGVAAEGTAWP